MPTPSITRVPATDRSSGNVTARRDIGTLSSGRTEVECYCALRYSTPLRSESEAPCTPCVVRPARGQSRFPMKIIAVVSGAIGVLLSMSSAGQERIASDQPGAVTGPPTQPTLMRVAPYPEEVHTLPGDAPPSCYRIGRCSAYDLYRFKDRPNRLARLAPEVPPPSAPAPSSHYVWVVVPVTPEQNILPKYRTASQIRDEYRAVGTPIDGRH